MSSGWAALATAVEAASPYPTSPGTGTVDGVHFEVAMPASARVSITEPWASGSLVTEQLAMQVPAYAQGVNVIAGSCGAMPLWAHKGDYRRVDAPTVLRQPDPDVAPSATWGGLYRDLVHRPYGWMIVLERFANGFPKHLRHVPFGSVQVTKAGILVDGVRVRDEDVKRFDSPFPPGALRNGEKIIRTALLIEQAVRRFATFDIPAGYLKQTAGPDLTDTEIDDLLTGWQTARETRNTAFLSGGLDYQNTSFNSQQLQLVEARAAITADIARLLNLPPSAVNAETGSSLTYSTVQMQQDALQAQTLWPYLTTVRERLSMDDITPHGTHIEIPSLGFLRTDLTGRANAYQTLIATGVLTAEEARMFEQLPPLPAGTNPPADDTGSHLP